MLNQFKRITPLLNRVVIRRFEVEKKSAGGILLTGSAEKDGNIGEVLSVGPGGYDEYGNFQEITLRPGQKVLLPNYGGSVVEHNNQKLSIYKDSEILAVLE
jgi:chaperonin GroES